MPRQPGSQVRWLLVFWMFVIGAVAFLDRVNISIAGSSIASEYHLTNVQLGWVFSAFLLGYAIFQTPGGWLADRLGPRRVIALAVIWWGIFTALTASIPVGVAGALLLLVAVRFLLGTGEAIMFPASNQFISKWIPTEERGIANGLIFAGVGIGAGMTPPLVTYIMLHQGWRASFWISAVIGIIVGAVWFIIARNTPGEHHRVSSQELEKIQRGLTIKPEAVRDGPGDASAHAMLVPWKAILKSKDVWGVTCSYFAYGYASWIFFSWFFIYLAKVRGMNLKSSADYAMLPFLAMAAGSPLGGIISDALTRWRGKRVGRCVFSFAVMGLAAVFLALGSSVHSAALASIVLAGGAGAEYLCQSCYWSVTADIAGPSAGSVSGFMNMGAQIGGAVTATLTPAIAGAYGWTASFITAAALCAVGGLAWLIVNPNAILKPQPTLASDESPKNW